MHLLQTGFTGVKCETNINDCTVKRCSQGTCIDGVEKAFCQCPVGKVGATCEKGKPLSVYFFDANDLVTYCKQLYKTRRASEKSN